jgi:hypothetical protein
LSTIALDLLESVLAHLDGAELHIAAAHVAAAIDVVREELAGLATNAEASA